MDVFNIYSRHVANAMIYLCWFYFVLSFRLCYRGFGSFEVIGFCSWSLFRGLGFCSLWVCCAE